MPPSEYHVAAHDPENCTSRLCINPMHLRWATQEQNVADQRVSGSMQKATPPTRPWVSRARGRYHVGGAGTFEPSMTFDSIDEVFDLLEALSLLVRREFR